MGVKTQALSYLWTVSAQREREKTAVLRQLNPIWMVRWLLPRGGTITGTAQVYSSPVCPSFPGRGVAGSSVRKWSKPQKKHFTTGMAGSQS